ncbi:MAG: amidase, partial [Dehalococcoidales bacterium]|nr:amidase [Dehalococcoidales bacterium]
MNKRELCFLTLAEQSRLIRDGEASPVDVVESALSQIERVDGKVNAFITVMADSARAAAREAEQEIARGDYRGPLHGIPIALKDLFYTKDVRTTAGSKILRDFVPDEDATVVTRLREAGAITIGKTNMHEWAFGPTNTNPHYGDVHNPWDLSRVSGGSSGGSAAAVAASMASAALGSDTGGSIRIPGALCGVVGLKPTYGRVSRYGAVPCAWSLDHVGPLCRTAEDAAIALGAIAGRDPKDPACSDRPVPDYQLETPRGIAGLRIAILKEYVADPTDPEVAAAFQAAVAALQRLGAAVEEVSLPEARYAVPASTAIMSAEASNYHEEML